MAWQGPQGGAPDGGPPDDETRTDWDALAADAIPPGGATPPGAEPPPSTPPAPPPFAPPGRTPSTTWQPPSPPPLPPIAPPPIAPPGATPGPPGPYGTQPGAWGAAPGGYGTPPGSYGAPGPGAGIPGAPVAWAPPVTGYAPSDLQVPGAPGLRFGSTVHRFLAYWLDALLVGLIAGPLAGMAVGISGSSSVTPLITTVIALGLEFVYFVGLWTSGGRATLGMRLMKLQIGNAFDGRTLTMGQAVIRWAALGLPFQALSIVPETAVIGGLTALWTLVLLISTAVSPTRQGLHDRFANSAIVQPIGAQTPATACLVLLLLLVFLPILAILALIFLGDQASTILSAIGESI